MIYNKIKRLTQHATSQGDTMIEKSIQILDKATDQVVKVNDFDGNIYQYLYEEICKTEDFKDAINDDLAG